MSAIKKYNSLIESGVDKTEAFEKSMVGASNGAKSFVQSSKTATVGITGLSISEKAATIATEALGVALNMALSFGIGLLIQAIITGITKLVNAEKEAQEKAEELRREATEAAKSYKDEVESLSNLTSEYVKLATTTSDLSTQKEKLLDIQNKINDGFVSEKEQVDLLNDSLSENLRLLDEQKYQEAKRTVSELEPQYEDFKRQFDYGKQYSFLGSVDKNEAKEVAKNIEQEFIDFFNATTDYYKAEWTDPFTGESRTVYSNILNTLNHANDLFIAGKSYTEVLDNLNLIIDSYREWDGHNSDTLKSLNALRSKYEELVQSENEVTTAYEAAQKSIQDYNDTFNSDASQRISEILEDAKELSTVLNSSTNETEKYNAIQELSDLEKEARNLAGTNEILKGNIDIVFNAIDTGCQSAIKSVGDLRSAWFENLKDFDKTTMANIDKMDKALKTITEGDTLSHGDFWELVEFDTDGLMRDIKLVGNEFRVSEKELVNLKDQYIQKQIESLKVTQTQIKANEEAAKQELVLAKKKLTDNSLFDTAARGSANLNNPAYRAYLDEVNSDIEKAENNVKELGDEWTRNNILIRELNSKLGYTAEITKAIADAYADSFVNAIDDQIKAVEKEKQALEDEKQVLQDQLDILEEQQKAIEEQIENYKTVAGVVEDEINKQTEALKKQQEAEEEIIQAKIDALKEEREQKEEENELLEKELAVQKKLRDLEKARNTKVRTFSSDRGLHYDVDKEAVANAESAVSEAQKAYDEAVDKKNYEAQVEALEEQKEVISKSYEERIKEYESYTEEWKAILEEQTNAENERIADEILGVEWREKIKDRDVNILNSFRSDFRSYNNQLNTLVNGEIASLKKSISAKEYEIKTIDKMLNKWNDYKAQVQNDINELKNQYDTEKNSIADMAYNDNLTLDNMEIRMWDFKENYKGYLQEVIDKVNECKDAMGSPTDTSWLTDEMGKIRISLEQWQDTLEELKKYNLHINSESDARYYREGSYSDGGVINYTGKANVHGKPQSVETAFNAAQGRSLYDMVRTGNFANLVASRALEGFNRAMVNNTNTNNNTSTSVTIQSMNINGVQNPAEFAREFNKNMEQYLTNELTKSYTR